MAYLEALRGEAPSGHGQAGTASSPRGGRGLPDRPTIELRPLRACADMLADWRDLARRALEPNVFHEPEIALAAAQHLVGAESTQALLVWSGPQGSGQRLLIGLFPVRIPGALQPFRQLKGLAHPYLASGVPLVDRDRAADVLGQVLGWLGSAEAPASSYLLPRIALGGAFAEALITAARVSGRGLSLIGRHPRNQFRPGAGQAGDMDRPARLERLRTLRDQGAARGRPEVVEAVEGQALRDAVEIFLALEASGERGRQGTAMMMQTRTGTFLRAATRGLGQGRHCRVLTLMQGESAVAAALLYESGASAWLVDLVHDETFTAYPADEFLALALTERQARQGRTLLSVQCAPGPQPQLDRLWPEQATVADILVNPARERQPAQTPAMLAGRAGISLAGRARRYLRRLVARRGAP